jgi:hypothetical protein
MTDQVWTDDDIGRLRGLWAEGLSTSVIGQRMRRSKCSVAGKADRLGLPGRLSPIRRDAVSPSARPVRQPIPLAILVPIPPLAGRAAGAFGGRADA